MGNGIELFYWVVEIVINREIEIIKIRKYYWKLIIININLISWKYTCDEVISRIWPP